jgi:hypothetical protein
MTTTTTTDPTAHCRGGGIAEAGAVDPAGERAVDRVQVPLRLRVFTASRHGSSGTGCGSNCPPPRAQRQICPNLPPPRHAIHILTTRRTVADTGLSVIMASRPSGGEVVAASIPWRRAGSGHARQRHLNTAADDERSPGHSTASHLPFHACMTSCLNHPIYPLKAVARVRIPSGLPKRNAIPTRADA